jgi:uncharacterized membrane protein
MSNRLFFVGMLLIFIGTLILIFSSILLALTNIGNVNVAGGALIMIGPIPILIGAGIPSVLLVFLIILMLTLMLLQLYLFLSFRKSSKSLEF